jgi:hypothetical protein
MTVQENINAFSDEIEKVINRFRDEFDLPYAAAVGVLHIAAERLSREAVNTEDAT